VSFIKYNKIKIKSITIRETKDKDIKDKEDTINNKGKRKAGDK
jgi:hypothetical protein